MCSPLRAQSHPGYDVTKLPLPHVFVPLYLYLLSGQAKAESGGVIDGEAWLQQESRDSSDGVGQRRDLRN